METKEKIRIALIGYGNIARSLLKGLLANGYAADCINIANPTTHKFKKLKQQNEEIKTFTSNMDAVEDATSVILCVKPDVVKTVCAEIQETLISKRIMLVSVAASVYVDLLQKWTSSALPIVRCMPNTPCAIGHGMTVLYANPAATDAHKKLVEDIFSTTGATVWLKHEKDMHIVTALSGSGPAYYFRVTEAFENAAIDLGCPSDIAHELAMQTFYGASQLAKKDRRDLTALRKQITSTGGTTESGIQVLEQVNVDKLALLVLRSAMHRSIEIARQLEDTE